MPSGCVSPSRTSSGVETSIVADAGSEAVLSALLKAVPKTPGRCSSARARSKVAKLFSETIACAQVASIFSTRRGFPKRFHPACFGGFWRFRADSRRIIFGGFSW